MNTINRYTSFVLCIKLKRILMKYLLKIWDWFLLIFALIPEKTSTKFDTSKSEDFLRGPKQ